MNSINSTEENEITINTDLPHKSRAERLADYLESLGWDVREYRYTCSNSSCYHREVTPCKYCSTCGSLMLKEPAIVNPSIISDLEMALRLCVDKPKMDENYEDEHDKKEALSRESSSKGSAAKLW